MKVLVLGSNGQLGTDLQRAVLGKGSADTWTFFDRQHLDLTHIQSIGAQLAAQSFDALVNCTSYTHVDRAESDADAAYLINAHAVAALAGVCRERRAKFVHISTDYVFSGMARPPSWDKRGVGGVTCNEKSDECLYSSMEVTPPNSRSAELTAKPLSQGEENACGAATVPYRETDKVAPINIYGASKAMGEALALERCPDTVVMRTASLFGVAGSSGKGGNFIETMIRMAKEGKPLRVVDDTKMSPTGTADLAAMLVAFLDRGATAGIYHAVNSGQVTWYALAVESLRLARIEADIEPITSDDYPTPARRPRYSVLDNRKLESVIGEIAPWQDALRRYLIMKGHCS